MQNKEMAKEEGRYRQQGERSQVVRGVQGGKGWQNEGMEMEEKRDDRQKGRACKAQKYL